MNTRKQVIVDRILKHYEKSKKSAIVVCGVKNLTAQQMQKIKQKIWEVGDVVYIKNSLFNKVVKQKINSEEKKEKGNNFVVFGNEEKDIFEILKNVNKTISQMQLKKDILVNKVFLSNNMYNDKQIKTFSNFNSKKDFEASFCMLFKTVPIKISKILKLVSERK